MKYVGILVLLLGFTAPVHAGEVDGKGLECTLVENPLNFGPKYYLFENGKVVQTSDPSTCLKSYGNKTSGKSSASTSIVAVYVFL